DRAIGLLALIILGGFMASYIALSPHEPGDAVARRCAQVAIGAAVILGGTALGLVVFYVPSLRPLAGLEFAIPPLKPRWARAAAPARPLPSTQKRPRVTHFFAILLPRKQGWSVSQAFALTMSIRLVQILWNLAGGLFVLRGGYHAPTEKEQEEMESNDEDEDEDKAERRADHPPITQISQIGSESVKSV